MYRVIFIFCVALLIVPRAQVEAIPPPDLIISAAQSIMSVLGVIMASVVIALASVKNYLRIILRTTFRRVLFGLGVLIFFVGVTTWLLLTEENRQLQNWQSGVDEEIRAVWEQYESVYIADDEKDARAALSGAATEVTWDEFQAITNEAEYLIVDIRDTHAYEVGHFPGSVHIRLADLIRGRYEELLMYKDTPILLVCFLGTTGTIASDFLAAEGFTELYIPKGGLHETLRRDDTPFWGVTRFVHFDEMINRLPRSTAQSLQAAGATVIDFRSPNQYNEPSPVTPDQSFFREFKTIPEIDSFVQSLATTTPYLSLCNSDASCYQAEMFLHDLKSAGRTAVGTYNLTMPAGLTW